MNRDVEDSINDDFSESLNLPEDQSIQRAPKHSSGKSKKALIGVIITILLFGGGFGVWVAVDHFFSNDSPEQIAANEPRKESVSNDSFDDIPDVVDTETTRTTTPRMEVTYPASWSLIEGDDDIRLESPPFSYTDNDGRAIDNGIFRIYFRQGAREVDSRYIGQGIAALPSEEITYKEPALGQRDKTSLSFFGLNDPSHITYFFVAGNFTLSPGETLGPDYGQEAETYIIAGGYSSPELEDDLQMHKVPIQYFRSTKAYAQALDIILSLKLL